MALTARPLSINLHRVVRLASPSPYERWLGLSVQARVDLLAHHGLDPSLSRWEWRDIPSRMKLKLKRALLGDFSHSLRTEESFLQNLDNPAEHMDYLQDRPDYHHW